MFFKIGLCGFLSWGNSLLWIEVIEELQISVGIGLIFGVLSVFLTLLSIWVVQDIWRD